MLIYICDDSAADRKRLRYFINEYVKQKNALVTVEEFHDGKIMLSSLKISMK